MGNRKSTLKTSNLRLRKNITKQDFFDYIDEMNKYFATVPLEGNTSLLFTLHRDSDSFVSWKENVCVACFQISCKKNKKEIKCCKLLDFESFMNAYDMKSITNVSSTDQWTTSTMILGESASNEGLCVICMEHKNEIMLPCLHSFCLVCITHESEYRPQFRCPLCQENIPNPIEESWLVADAPMKTEVDEYLGELTKAKHMPHHL
ncbi:unnamed protein product [Auanema sp. JU1783]|nr:unnamed protein product [Auanema sp. JU1783]